MFGKRAVKFRIYLGLYGQIEAGTCFSSGVLRGAMGGVGVFNIPHPRNSEGPPKSCQIQPDCEKCSKLLNLGSQHPKMFGKKEVKF